MSPRRPTEDASEGRPHQLVDGGGIVKGRHPEPRIDLMAPGFSESLGTR